MSIVSERCRRRIMPALLTSACGLALAACGTSLAPRPSAALLLPCADPLLVPDPEAATSEEINVERLNVARAYADCKQRHADLVTFVKGASIGRGAQP